MTDKTTKVALYARVSKHDTKCINRKTCERYSTPCDHYYAERSPRDRCKEFAMTQNPENQLVKLREYAKKEGFEVFHEYVDRASGADPNRPQLAQMMRDAKGHRFTMILALRIDRFARSMPNFHNTLQELEAAKCNFRCTEQPEIATDTPMGRFITGIMGYIAQLERDLIIERTQEGVDRAIQGGSKFGRPRKELDFDRIYALRDKGYGIRKVAGIVGVAPETLRAGLRRDAGKSRKPKVEEPPRPPEAVVVDELDVLTAKLANYGPEREGAD